MSKWISFWLKESGFDDLNGDYESKEGIAIQDDVETIIIGGNEYSFKEVFSKHKVKRILFPGNLMEYDLQNYCCIG